MQFKAVGKTILCLSVVLSGKAVLAQGHYHSIPHTTTHYDIVRHGNHYHRVPHTTTHYDQVYHNGPDYYPNYQSYGSPYSVPYSSQIIMPSSPVIGSSIVASPGTASPNVVYASPSTSTPIASAPSSSTVALKPNMLPYTGPGVRIRLPKDLGGEVNYILDQSIPGEIRAGMEQHLTKKKSYEIRFSRGINSEGVNLGEARYTISEGLYAFAITDHGWDIYRQPDAPAVKTPTSTEPALKANKLPAASTPKETTPTENTASEVSTKREL